MIPWPIDAVRDVVQSRVHRLVAYLGEIEEVVEVERRTSGDAVIVVRRWSFGPDALPAGLVGLVPEGARGFVDRLTWVGDRATFEVEPLIHADLVTFGGDVRLEPDVFDTLLKVEGTFSLRPAARDRLPPSLQGRGVDALEATVVATIRQHLGRACRAVDRLLDEET